MDKLTLGTRGSKLALAQAELVANALRRMHPTLRVELRLIKTAGDKAHDTPLSKIGGAGVFVKEIEFALLRGEIDAAVHSAKDLPSRLPRGLMIAACLPRGDARDALVMRAGDAVALGAGSNPFEALPQGAWVGTGSVRRAACLLRHRSDLQVRDVRGNVDSRLRRLLAGDVDALVLAMAGLERLTRLEDDDVRVIPIAMQHMLPAVAQGTLAVEAREDDAPTIALLKAIDHSETHTALIAERAFLRAFDAGCQAPIAAHAQINGNRIALRGAVGMPDGTVFAQAERKGPVDQADEIGTTLAQRVLNAGGQTILDVVQSGVRPLQNKRIIITRATERSESLGVKLSALGATPVFVPVIEYAPAEGSHALDIALHDLCSGVFDWVAFTSATAIEVCTAWMAAQGYAWPAATRIAVVGEATARTCEDALGHSPDCMPDHYDAASLAEAMADMSDGRNLRVLLPNADIAQPALQNALQSLGMRVSRVIAYQTKCRESSKSDLSAHAIVFTSSSTVQCFASQFDSRSEVAVCIGKQTAQSAASAGFTRIVTAPASTEAGLIEALLRAAEAGAFKVN